MLVLLLLTVHSSVQDTKTNFKANNDNLEKVFSDMNININKAIDINNMQKIIVLLRNIS